MKVESGKFVALSYVLTVDGNVADRSPEGQPLKFVCGSGMLLPKFEENIAGLGLGDKFEFTLTPADGYGEIIGEAVVELPINVFEVNGKVEEGLLVVGNHIPMMSQDGQRMVGVVVAVSENNATLDFNHPMAGKTLNFTGEIVEVREPSPEEIMPAAGGCGCGDSDCGEGSCEDKGCGCN